MTNTIAIIEKKIATLYAAKQELIDRVKAGVSKSTEKKLDAKFAELDLQQEILEEVLEEIEAAPAVEKKAPAQPVDVFVVKNGKKFDGFGKEVKEEAPAVEEAPAAPEKSQTIYQAIVEQYGPDVIINNKAMGERIKREQLVEVLPSRVSSDEVVFWSNGTMKIHGQEAQFGVRVKFIKKYQQYKVLAI